MISSFYLFIIYFISDPVLEFKPRCSESTMQRCGHKKPGFGS